MIMKATDLSKIAESAREKLFHTEVFRIEGILRESARKGDNSRLVPVNSNVLIRIKDYFTDLGFGVSVASYSDPSLNIAWS